MKITIDPSSGFCFGVKQAIEKAEKLLETGETLYCLGDIVHNRAEIGRLEKLGLKITDHHNLGKIGGQRLLFRAHGEPPSSYRSVSDQKIELTDATCPIVLKLQEKITAAWKKMGEEGGQVVIYGNPNHPETIGLKGQTDNQAIIVIQPEQLTEIDPSKPVALFAQTTKSRNEYKLLEENLRNLMSNHFDPDNIPLTVHNTICGQVSGRAPKIREFAINHDVIVFVGGQSSSNARVLFEECLKANSNSYFISYPDEIEKGWFKGAKTTGICGATSTPAWLMEDVAKNINLLLKSE